MSKRNYFLIMMVIILSLGLILTGCQSSDNNASSENQQAAETESQETPVAEEPLTLTIAHSAIGGTWNTIAEGIGEILRKEFPNSNISVVPGNGQGNLARLHNNEVELALSTSVDAKDAIEGLDHFNGNQIKDLTGITALFSPMVQFFVMDDVDLNSIEEIKEKKYPLKLSVHTKGSGIEATARRLFEFYDLTYDDIESWGGKVVFVGSKDAAEMMANGQLDAYFGFSTVPISNFVELEIKHNFKLLPLSEEAIKYMYDEYEYPAGVVKTGAYKGVTEDIPTISEITGLYASPNLDQETAYKITKALLENLDALGQVHVRLKDLDPTYMSKDLVYPLNEGAQKAFEEAGVQF